VALSRIHVERAESATAPAVLDGTEEDGEEKDYEEKNSGDEEQQEERRDEDRVEQRRTIRVAGNESESHLR